jgi:tRNA1Val (adenine37-N6)-methyltransferase
MLKVFNPILNYSQPEFYKFSDISVKLAHIVSRYLQNENIKPQNGLDLCCGCGIIGLELLTKFPLIKKFSFLDIQKECMGFTEGNVSSAYGGVVPNEISFLNKSFRELKEYYDLIVCNPPFFFNSKSRVTSNDKKNICRYWEEEDLVDLISFLDKQASLGAAFFLLLPERECIGEQYYQYSVPGAQIITNIEINFKV